MITPGTAVLYKGQRCVVDCFTHKYREYWIVLDGKRFKAKLKELQLL